jgi:hypothetical protein
MLETPQELDHLQELLDASMVSAGPHLRDIIGEERRISAPALAERLQGLRLLVLATASADGRPLTAPVDGYFLHGMFWFSLGAEAVRTRHLRVRPHVSATYLRGEGLAVTVHGTAERFAIGDPACAELRQAMLDEYVPKQGPSFGEWLEHVDAVGARIVPEKMFTFQLAG